MDIDDLFSQTLRGDYDADLPWDAVRSLSKIGSREVFNRAAAWCGSQNPLERARGVDVLAQLGKTSEHPETAYAAESFPVVSTVALSETDPRPLSSAIHALGHIANPLAIPLLTMHQNHPDPDVRFAVACALGNFADNPVAATTLIEMTRDVDDDVRNWATFAIGTLTRLNSPELRDALIAGLSDPYEDVREEAIAGLARFKDKRVLPALLSALEESPVAENILDAARELLGIEDGPAGWVAKDYAKALRERFA
jgi:HEAT repeat protein